MSSDLEPQGTSTRQRSLRATVDEDLGTAWSAQLQAADVSADGDERFVEGLSVSDDPWVVPARERLGQMRLDMSVASLFVSG